MVSTIALPLVVQPNGTFTVDARFSPTANGARAATLSAVVTGQMANSDASLTGNGIAAKLTVTPNPIEFGGSTVGKTLQKTITISNDGAGKIAISDITVSPAEYKIVAAPDLPVVISSGGSFDVTLTFTPSKNGLAAGTLTVLSNDPNAPTYNVAMTGYAGPPSLGTGPASSTPTDGAD